MPSSSEGQDPAPLLPGDPGSVGPFRVLGRLGAGGMGVVYLGQSAAGRLAAVKVIRAEYAADAQFRQRFAREIASAKRVSAVYTAAVIDADPHAVRPWLATTYVRGASLFGHVRANGQMPAAAVFVLALGLAEALAAIHREGLIHRDLKPANILLTAAGPFIIDFGIALPADASRLTTGTLLGTPSFTAPERLTSGAETAAGDIFSLGATLVYAATGHGIVAETGGPMAQLSRMARGQYQLGDVPRPLRALIIRCTSRLSADRPTASELVQILAAMGVQQPTSTWLTTDVGSTPVGRPRLPFTRRKIYALAASALATLAAGATAAAYVPGLASTPPAATISPLAAPASSTPALPPATATASLWPSPAGLTITEPLSYQTVGACVTINGSGAKPGQRLLIFDAQHGSPRFYFNGMTQARNDGGWSLRVNLGTPQQTYEILVYSAPETGSPLPYDAADLNKTYTRSQLPPLLLSSVSVLRNSTPGNC